MFFKIAITTISLPLRTISLDFKTCGASRCTPCPHLRELPMKRFLIASGLLLSIACGPRLLCADIVDDAVFAYDFENVSGSTVTALRGSNGTINGGYATNTDMPLSFSSQHLRAPTDNSWASINTNASLAAPITELSFSAMYNANGDNGSEANGDNLVRFLSTYDGAGAADADQTGFSMLGSGTDRTLRLGFGSLNASSSIFNFDNTGWQHVGFSVNIAGNDASVQFYVNGAAQGAAQVISGLSEIVAQDSAWHLFEDTTDVGITEEYFDGGDYDEAALWNRQLSASDFQDIAANGLAANAVPEPSFTALGMLALSLVFSRKRNRR